MRGILGMALLLVAPSAFASGVATLATGSGQNSETMVLEYDDQGHVRMNMPKSQEGAGYMLNRDGKIWMVMNMQGQVMVMDMARMAAMAAPTGDDAMQQEFISAKPTGDQEMVAGFKGEVYDLKWKDKKGVQSARVVLSRDPVVVEYSNAWMQFAENMAKSMGQKTQNSIGDYLKGKGLGMLRMGDDFKVVSIEPGKVNARDFVLPKATMQMPMFGG
ncbi:hypothetical protein [Thiolapillus brandeum]|nr:hypothetical protein [Thiolapillus brandeum]